MSDFKTIDELREWLLADEMVVVHAWTFSASCMSCGDWSCCSDDYEDVEEAISSIMYYANTIDRVEKF